MGDLRKGVRLVHELGQLAGAEKLVDDGRDRFCVHQVVGHHGLHVLEAHLFFDRPLHPDETDAVLVFDEFPHGADPAVAQVIDVVHAAVTDTAFEIKEVLDRRQDVFVSKVRHIGGHIEVKLVVHLHAAHVGNVVGLGIEKEALEEPAGRLGRGGVARPEPPVDLDDGLFLRFHLVDEQGLHNGGVHPVFVQVNEPDLLDLLLPQDGEPLLRQFLVAGEEHLAGFRVPDGRGQDLLDKIFVVDGDPIQFQFLDALEGGFRDFTPFLDDDLAALADILGRLLVEEEVADLDVGLAIIEENLFDTVEIVQGVLDAVPYGFQQNRHGHLPPAVDAHVEEILGVEFEVQPGAPDRDDAGGVKELAAGVGLALVVIVEDAG